MKIILLQDIKKLGKKYEIKEVKPGYARNFLIPKNLAKPVTKQILKWVEIQKQIALNKAEQELEKIEKQVANIDGLEIVIPVKVGKEGQLFESISAQKIIEALKNLGFQIKKNQIELENPIREIGEFPIKIKFEHNLEAEIKVIINNEEKEFKN